MTTPSVLNTKAQLASLLVHLSEEEGEQRRICQNLRRRLRGSLFIEFIEEAKEMSQMKQNTKKTTTCSSNGSSKKQRKKRQQQGERRFVGFNINDHPDLVMEVLSRLDARSLASAARVCHLWSSLCRQDTLWESLCHRHYHTSTPPPPVRLWESIRPVVEALGGYRRLYAYCVQPALARLRERDRRRLTLSLSLTLFSVHCYERLGGRDEAPSLWFLYNVS